MGLRRQSRTPETLEDHLAALVSGLTPGVSAKITMITTGMSRPIKQFALEQIVRIGGEALQNAVSHAEATLIEIAIHYEDAELLLSVRDDGRGFEVGRLGQGSSGGHFGVIGMYERADRVGGQLKIVSRELEGTEVTLKISNERLYETAQAPGFRRRLLRLWQPPADAD
jgi:signal transduction histidine kinase